MARKHRYEESWRQDSSWGHGAFGIYFRKDDPRLVVPKRNPSLGWTLNMAHRHAGLVLLGAMAMPALIVIAVTALGI